MLILVLPHPLVIMVKITNHIFEEDMLSAKNILYWGASNLHCFPIDAPIGYALTTSFHVLSLWGLCCP